jgi:hypothetical protein
MAVQSIGYGAAAVGEQVIEVIEVAGEDGFVSRYNELGDSLGGVQRLVCTSVQFRYDGAPEGMLLEDRWHSDGQEIGTPVRDWELRLPRG